MLGTMCMCVFLCVSKREREKENIMYRSYVHQTDCFLAGNNMKKIRPIL